jgi:uncharacterized protein (DUF983 family)
MEMAMRSAFAQPVDLVHRGYQVAYHPGETNRCPGCGHSNWHVGRVTAQCAFCGTALALALSVPTFGLAEDQLAYAH